MSNTIGLKRALLQSVVAAGGIAVAALIVTAPTAGATDAKDTCKQMHGKLSTDKDGKGNTYESCSVNSGGGEVVGTWVNGQWQGAVSPSDGNPGPGHKWVPIGSTPQ
jgi:hypothetical protein